MAPMHDPRPRRVLLTFLCVLLLLPLATAGTLVSNTKITSPQLGLAHYVSENDGVDWGAQFATTLNKISTPGGRITEKEGLRTLTTVVTVSKSNVLLDFYGVKANSPSQAAHLVTISGHNVTLAGLYLDASNITGASCGIRVTGSNVTIRDVIVEGAAKGICLEGAINPTLDRVVLMSQTTNGVSIASTTVGAMVTNALFQGAPVNAVSISSDSVGTRLLMNRFELTSGGQVSDASTSTIRLDASGWALQDVVWTRDAANRWKTVDDVILSSTLGIGVTSSPVKLGVSDGGAIAQTGLIGIPNNKGISARNAANNGDFQIIGSDTSNNVVLGGTGANSVRVTTGPFLVGDASFSYGSSTITVDRHFKSASHITSQGTVSGEGSVSFQAGVGGTTNGKLVIYGATAATEGNIYHDATYPVRIDTVANAYPIRIDGSMLDISAPVHVQSSTGILFGQSQDVQLNRPSAGVLATNGSIRAGGGYKSADNGNLDLHLAGSGGYIRVLDNGQARLRFGPAVGATKLQFSDDGATWVSLYSASSNTVLKTDNGLTVAGTVTAEDLLSAVRIDVGNSVSFGGCDANLRGQLKFNEAATNVSDRTAQCRKAGNNDTYAWSTLAVLVGVPANATTQCGEGEWAEDDAYLYVCIAANTWRRTALATWS